MQSPCCRNKTCWPKETICNGVNGYLVGVDDVDGQVQGVSRILVLDDVAWREMSQADFLTVTDSRWVKLCVQLETVLRRTCQ
jgi:hypothetical protein